MSAVDIEAMLARPRPCISADSFGIEDFLRGAHDLVRRIPARIRRVGVAPLLHPKYLGQLLRYWFFRRKNPVYVLIALGRYFGQSAPQKVDGVCTGIKGFRLFLIFLG
ncbi:hypothetical protein [Mycobacterium malmoense]|uniref:hypothetical protein n=1 Tax=Mycobacterium malmoense TaxID=1780 RepID=UPI0011467F13|nr:hypothetical protein [Mycobacterium malmoense]